MNRTVEKILGKHIPPQTKEKINIFSYSLKVLRLQTIKAIIDSCSFKGLKSDEPRRVQVLDLYCLTTVGLRAKVQVKGLSIKD